MKILIVDDDRINSTILSRLLGREGHPVITASNGQDGVRLFEAEKPDLVLMDIRMPLMDGYEAARRIKRLSPDHFVPIIFLTAVTDDEGLAKCIEAGGDDFLTKPFNRIILQAKINALERIQQLHSVLRLQKEQLERHQDSVRQELEVGKHIFSNIVRAGSLLDAPCLNHSTHPMSLFNGDLLVASYNPAGGLHIMLGDFTGHGLSAAVGALPLSELFYGMTAQGFSIGDLVTEMNSKLLTVMPTRMFCAACLIEVDPRQNSLMIWNGGLPDILIIDGDGQLVQRVPSSHLPLGVASLTPGDRKIEILEMRSDYRVLLYSDGLTEATEPSGEMYGTERLDAHFNGQHSPDRLFDLILEDVEIFRDGAEQTDDISLLEIDCAKAGDEPPSGSMPHTLSPIQPSDWEASFSFSADTLKSVDPLPPVTNMVMNIQAPAGHRERIYTILAELFSNALDHGLLNLDTRTKQTPEGFIQYYSQREERLANLEEGFIRLSLHHTPLKNGNGTLGGEIRIHLEDSGPGFDHTQVQSQLEGNLGHGGRGIALVRSLCVRLDYRGNGNVAEAVYQWTCQ
ncbi:MAG: fused response regulator/phosphatase [Magnetococcales bacterium]|nr:fused response regulator/phosphatase [Magnetococcales bacterium]